MAAVQPEHWLRALITNNNTGLGLGHWQMLKNQNLVLIK
jgi:hypothetical protein